MGHPDGVHHLAISTADIKTQIEFFTDVLGAELRALYWMHGAPDTIHGFVRLSDHSYVAFVQSAAVKATGAAPGVSHAENYASASAPGTMQHVAFNVASMDELLAVRDRIRSRGINVFGPLDHGLCHSIYFAGPEGLLLEAAWSAEAIDDRAWIDPEVVDLVGISADELDRFVHPAAFSGEGGRRPQPEIDWSRPHFGPRANFEWLMTTPDDVVIARLSEPDPPVKVPADLG